MMAKAKDKEEPILRAATQVFGKKGFHSANISDIAECAGIGKGTIYEYFSSKEDLFLEALKSNCQYYFDILSQQMSIEGSFVARMDRFIDFHLILTQKHKHMAELMRQNEGMALSSELRKRVQGILHKLRSDVKKLLCGMFLLAEQTNCIRLLDRDFTADIFYDATIRCCVRALISDFDDEEMQKEKGKLIDLFMHGIGLGEIGSCK